MTSSHPFSRVSASFLVFTCVSQGIFRVSFFIRLAVLIASVLELPNSVETHHGGFKWSFPFIIKCRSSISSVHHRQLLSFVSRKTCKLNLRLNVSSKWNNLIYLFCLCWKRSFFFRHAEFVVMVTQKGQWCKVMTMEVVRFTLSGGLQEDCLCHTAV